MTCRDTAKTTPPRPQKGLCPAMMPAPSSSPTTQPPQQPSLYDFFSPIPTNDSSPTPLSSSNRTPFQEATRHNVPLPLHNPQRISAKRRRTCKLAPSSSPPDSAPADKGRSSPLTNHVSKPLIVIPVRPRATIPRSIIDRSLSGSRGSLSSCAISISLSL